MKFDFFFSSWSASATRSFLPYYYYSLLIISFVVIIAVRSPAVMTTRRFSSDESIYKSNRTRHDGSITNRRRNGSYNIVEKEYDDHKVIYHIPIEYGDDYDISQLEDISIDDEFSQRNSPKLTRRRIIQQYEDVEYDDEREYVEEIPVYTPRRRVYYSPRRRRDPPIIRKVYRTRSPIETVEYIYEDDSSDFYDYRPQPVEQVEYVIEERLPPTKQIVRLELRTHTHISARFFTSFFELFHSIIDQILFLF